MANNDSTKIKELLEIIKHKIDMMDIRQTGQSASISLMKDQQSVMNKKLDELQESVDANTASLIEVEATLKGYGDMYKINGHNIKRLNKRLKKVESKLEIYPPQELFIPN